MKKKIILTFDYELFFGDVSGTVEKSIIIPTYKILDTLDSLKLRGSFFVDYLMLKYLEVNSDKRCQEDLMLLKKQICNIVSRGHRIELHLHPHWIDAKYQGNGFWDFSDFSHYMLSTLDESEINRMFCEGTLYLNKLAQTVDPDYKVLAFRAGGWAVQSFDKLINGFHVAGLKIDSSASYGMFCTNEDKSFDFRRIPKGIYKFNNDVCEEAADGQFWEIPITSYRKSLLYKIVGKLFPASGGNKTDGTHLRSFDNNKLPQRKPLLQRLFVTNYYMLSFSQFSSMVVFLVLLFNREKIVCAIDHPKDFSNETLKGIKKAAYFCNSYTFKDFINDTESNIF